MCALRASPCLEKGKHTGRKQVRACWEERKKREIQEEIQGEQSRDGREKEEQECDTGGRVGGRRLH